MTWRADEKDHVLRQLASVGCYPEQFVGRARSFRCPECSHKRKKKTQKCMKVWSRVDGCGAVCGHCGWGGGLFYADAFGRSGGIRSKARDKPRDFGASGRRQRYHFFS